MSRTRSRTTVGPAYGEGNVFRDFLDGSPDQSVWNRTNILLQHEYETMTDVVDSGFHAKSAEGDVVINPVTHVKTSVKTTGSGRLDYKKKYKAWNSVYECQNLTAMMARLQPGRMQPKPAEPDVSHDLLSSARLQALGNIDRSPYSFAEDIAELRETLRFLKDPLGSIKRLGDAFSKDTADLLAKRKYLRRVDAIADVWLSYQFAFMPLVRSSCDFIESFGDNIKIPKRRTARGKATFTAAAPTNDGVISSWHTYHTLKVEHEVHAGLLYEVSNPLRDWKFKYGLRFKDIPETLWAIFPYSFMVDRVFNLSQAVRGATAFLDPNVKILGGWDSQKKTLKSTRCFYNYTGTDVETMNEMTPDYETTTVKSYERAIWEPTIGDFIPEVRVKELVSDATKIADLFALVWARIR